MARGTKAMPSRRRATPQAPPSPDPRVTVCTPGKPAAQGMEVENDASKKVRASASVPIIHPKGGKAFANTSNHSAQRELQQSKDRRLREEDVEAHDRSSTSQ
ncbi:hypothetical protein U9M48_000647 [Paspalum notatum var. saurae]|uniref:Uncharacterized protein n=1 Tax=Paspalum notatum var. saurae TaxID=547442 RepID=A0AAQ3SHJ9_PASNO